METLFKNTETQSFAVESKKLGHKKQILRAIYFNGIYQIQSCRKTSI